MSGHWSLYWHLIARTDALHPIFFNLFICGGIICWHYWPNVPTAMLLFRECMDEEFADIHGCHRILCSDCSFSLACRTDLLQYDLSGGDCFRIYSKILLAETGDRFIEMCEL